MEQRGKIRLSLLLNPRHVNYDLFKSCMSVRLKMEDIHSYLIIHQDNNVLYEAGLMPGFCIKNQPRKREHLPLQHLVLYPYA